MQIITALGENKLVFILGGLIVYGIGNSIINYYSNMPLVKALANTDGGGAVKQGSGVAFVDGCLQSISTITYTPAHGRMISRDDAEAAATIAVMAAS